MYFALTCLATPDSCKWPARRLRDQDTWTRQQLQQNGTQDLYWKGIDLVMHQFDGMVDGYEAHRQHKQGQGADGVQLPELGKDGFLFTNGNGELAEKRLGKSCSQCVNRNNRAAQAWPLWVLVARTAARR